MPTGYTAPIYEGKDITGHEFILRCSRAFGYAGWQMRDSSLDVPPPNHATYDPTHDQKQLDEARAKLAEVAALSIEEADRRAREAYDESHARADRLDVEAAEKAERYGRIRREVEAWVPPTEEHANLKKYALEQLDGDIKAYCTPYEWRPEAPQSGLDWRADRIAAAQREVDRAEERITKGHAYAEEGTAWLQALWNSLDVPEREAAVVVR